MPYQHLCNPRALGFVCNFPQAKWIVTWVLLYIILHISCCFGYVEIQFTFSENFMCMGRSCLEETTSLCISSTKQQSMILVTLHQYMFHLCGYSATDSIESFKCQNAVSLAIHPNTTKVKSNLPDVVQLSESFRLKLIFLCVCTFLKLRRHWQILLWISHWLNRNIRPICNKLSIPHHDNPNITRQIQVNQHLHLADQRWWTTTHKPPTNVKCSAAATCVSYLTLIQMKWVAQKKLLEILPPNVQKLERSACSWWQQMDELSVLRRFSVD